MKNVKEIMGFRPRCCRKNEKLRSIASEMFAHSIGSMPVLDKENKVIGMITDRDILSALLQKEGKGLDEIRVEEAMTREVYTCFEYDSVATALKIMRLKKIGRLPVTDKNGQITGIISLNAIIRQLHGSNYGAEVVFEGKENIVNTLHSIAERNRRLSFEYGDFKE
ncbi:MAG: CBS domain-containing protein [Bacteroidia bacterium]